MLASICSIAEKSFLLIHKALSLFLPISLLSRLEKRHYVLDARKQHSSKNITKTVLHQYISHTFSPVDFKEYLAEESVFIFPDDMMLSIFMEMVEKEKNILVLPHEATASKRIQAWIDIYE